MAVNQPEGEPAPIEYSPTPEDAARIIEAFDDQRASVAGEVQAMLRGDDEEEPGRGLLPLPGYPYPRAVSVPELPPRITVFPPGSFADGCNDWPSACQPHFALHAMLTSWILTRLAAVAGFITPATFRNLTGSLTRLSPSRCAAPTRWARILLQHPRGIQGPGDVRPGPGRRGDGHGQVLQDGLLDDGRQARGVGAAADARRRT